jgi:hypothetical protein
MTSGQRLRQLANVLNGSTLLGLLLAAAARTAVGNGPRGLLIATGYRWRLPFAGAFTVGNMVLFRAGPAEALANLALLGHEERQSTQYAWCLGVPFLPLYFLAAGWSLWRTGNPATGNFFERNAGLQAGGYLDGKLDGLVDGKVAGKLDGKLAGSPDPGPAAPERNEA